MKRLFLFLLMAVALASCTSTDEAVSPDQEQGDSDQEDNQNDDDQDDDQDDDGDDNDNDDSSEPEWIETTLTLEGQLDFPSATSSTVSTITVDDVKFTLYNAWYNDYYGSYTITKETNGYFGNSTELTGLSKVVVTEDYTYYNYDLYVGTSACSLELELSYAQSGSEYTYTIPEGYNYATFVNGETDYNATCDKIVYTYLKLDDGSGGDSNSGGDDNSGDEYDPSEPEGGGETKYKGWAELPDEDDSKSGDYYYAYHMRADATSIRNFSVCYSKDKMCPVWVASPMHTCYTGSASRTDAYADDPDIPFTEAAKWDGYTRGHMLGSSDRLVSTATNAQVFYHSNIAPQLGYVNGGGFNTGGGVWNNLEEYTDDQWCSDTLYLVNGAYWANNNTKVDDTTIPTHYYKVMLRTKSGNSGKVVWDCEQSELKCVAFIVEHNTDQHMVDPHSGMMMSVTEIEALTGHTFFSNVPNAPKDSYDLDDWDM